jgi:hypothetical protein
MPYLLYPFLHLSMPISKPFKIHGRAVESTAQFSCRPLTPCVGATRRSCSRALRILLRILQRVRQRDAKVTWAGKSFVLLKRTTCRPYPPAILVLKRVPMKCHMKPLSGNISLVRTHMMSRRACFSQIARLCWPQIVGSLHPASWEHKRLSEEALE